MVCSVMSVAGGLSYERNIALWAIKWSFLFVSNSSLCIARSNVPQFKLILMLLSLMEIQLKIKIAFLQFNYEQGINK